MSSLFFNRIKSIIPRISDTELIALRSGTVSIDREIFQGNVKIPERIDVSHLNKPELNKGVANVLRKYCHRLLNEIDDNNIPLLKLANKLEEIALNDDYFIKKKLYPNVDFYSGIILKAMGFPTDMFTVLFAVARTVGWVAQWNEMITDPVQRIGRPRQLYTGNSIRDFIELKNR